MKLTKKQKIAIWTVSVVGMVIWLLGVPVWFDMVDMVMK